MGFLDRLLGRTTTEDGSPTKKFKIGTLDNLADSVGGEAMLIQWLTIAKVAAAAGQPPKGDDAFNLLATLYSYYLLGASKKFGGTMPKYVVFTLSDETFIRVPGPYAERIRDWVAEEHPKWIVDARF